MLFCCCVQASSSASGAVDIQILTVPPTQLRQHAAASACGVAALPAGALRLPPGASYDAAVEAVVAAVETQFYQQLLAAAAAQEQQGKQV